MADTASAAMQLTSNAAKNFKGVMLCDRPAEVATKWQDGHKYRPFLPTSKSAANEQLGLTPAYKVTTDERFACGICAPRHVDVNRRKQATENATFADRAVFP